MLMGYLIEVARARGVRHTYAAEADGCTGFDALAEGMVFRSRPDPEDRSVTVFERTLA